MTVQLPLVEFALVLDEITSSIELNGSIYLFPFCFVREIIGHANLATKGSRFINIFSQFIPAFYDFLIF